MNKFRSLFAVCIAVLAFSLVDIGAQNVSPSSIDIAKQVSKSIRKLPRYEVFDYIDFTVEGSVVTLNGKVNNAINKSDAAQTAGIAVTHTTQFHTARVYTLTAGSSQPQRQPDIAITLTNAFQYTMPANSVTTLVLAP